MKTSHTPGTWHAHDGQIYPEETGKTLALIPYFDAENKEQEANALLIAAGPELLDALIKAKQLMFAKGLEQTHTMIWDIVCSALTKAGVTP